MLTRPFDNPRLARYSSEAKPLMQMSSYAVPLGQGRSLDDGPFSAEIGWSSEAVVDVGALGKGVRWALAIEGCAALSIYCIWHLWSLLR